jgi:hypothetical protein
VQLSNEGGTVRQPVGPICIRALAGLLLLFFVAPSLTIGTVGMAEETSTAPSVIASKLLNQIKVALQSMQEECGSTVFTDNRGEVLCKGHGEETIGAAWNRHLTAVGVPGKLSDREALASAINLDPQASLALGAGIARLDAIEYLLSQLRHISGKD